MSNSPLTPVAARFGLPAERMAALAKGATPTTDLERTVAGAFAAGYATAKQVSK